MPRPDSPPPDRGSYSKRSPSGPPYTRPQRSAHRRAGSDSNTILRHSSLVAERWSGHGRSQQTMGVPCGLTVQTRSTPPRRWATNVEAGTLDKHDTVEPQEGKNCSVVRGLQYRGFGSLVSPNVLLQKII